MTASVPIAFENIEYLLGVLPVIVIGWVLIHKGARRSLILSRIIIVSLLVVALAGPYNPVTVTEIDETPTITVLSDETESMDIFESGTAEEIFDKLQDTTPAKMEKMGGLRSDIGDEILASSTGDDHIIVVSDGNNNFGSDLAETIDFVSGTGTVVYGITQTPEKNDLSVEITGARTAVLGNENLVGVEVRQAESNTTYKLSIEVDGSPVSSQTVTQTKSIKIVGFSSTFQSLGPHLITARISSGDDMRTENNVFNKTIYVVPKPRILLVSPDDDSPLYKVLRNLYETNTASSLDDANLTDYKAVVLDNINDGRLSGSSIGKLRDIARIQAQYHINTRSHCCDDQFWLQCVNTYGHRNNFPGRFDRAPNITCSSGHTYANVNDICTFGLEKMYPLNKFIIGQGSSIHYFCHYFYGRIPADLEVAQ